MKDYGLVLIHNKEENSFKIDQKLESVKGFFKSIVIVSHSPEKFGESLFPVIVPFMGNSFFSQIYSGLFFMEDKNILALDSGFLFPVLKNLEKLKKNLHKGVDAALFYEKNKYILTPGAYSTKILNKFRKNVFDPDYDELFIQRMKINKIFNGES